MTPHVTVVGGGVSGLAAAVRLASAGVPVRLLEARGVLGGRATSFVDRRTGETFDNGQHALMGCYRETLRFLDTIGSRALVETAPSLSVTSIDPHGDTSVLQCPSWPPPLHLLGGVLSWSGVSWSDRLQVLAMGGALLRARRAASGPAEGLPCRPEETVAAWLARHGQGPRVRDLLWEPLALAALNQHIDHAAAVTFVRVLGRVFGPGRTDASVVMPTRPLVDVFGRPARAFLESRGASVELDALARIVIERGAVRGVRVREDEQPAVLAVLAAPWHTWPSTLAGEVAPLEATLAAAAATRPSSILTVTLSYDRPVLPTPMLGLPGRDMQWAFDTAVLGGAAPGTRVALVCSGADDLLKLTNDRLAAHAHGVLASALPAARTASLVGTRTIREPRATFSLAPGQPARPGTRTTVKGLYLASDWVDTGLPATIEGAIDAGHRAATAVLEDLGTDGTVAGRDGRRHETSARTDRP